MSGNDRLLARLIAGAFRPLVILLSRLREPFLPPQKREQLRALRERIAQLEHDGKSYEARMGRAQTTGEMLNATEDFIEKHGDETMKRQIRENHEPLRAMEREAEALKTIQRETGEDFGTASVRFQEYVQENPSTRLGRTYLAGTLRMAGKWDAALEVLRDLQQLERAESSPYPKDLMTRLSIGQVLYDKGEFDAAMAEFNSLLAEPPQFSRPFHGIIYLSLGTVHLAKNERKEAHNAWKKAMKADKSGTIAERAKELMKNNPVN